jgi:hypothetical protein
MLGYDSYSDRRQIKINKPSVCINNQFKATIFTDIKRSTRKLNTYKLLNICTSEPNCNAALLGKEQSSLTESRLNKNFESAP